jgi:hypothetical protein
MCVWIYRATGPPEAQNGATALARGGRGVPSNGFEKRAQLPLFGANRQAKRIQRRPE